LNSIIAARAKEESYMQRKPQTQSKNNVCTMMTKLNQTGRQSLDELRSLTETLLDLPVSNSVIFQRGLQLYLEEFRRQLGKAKQLGENGMRVIGNWVASERLNLIRVAEGATTNTNLKEEKRTE
jgi:hypothetical protein